MKVVGRSGIVQDLPDGLARCLLRDPNVRVAEQAQPAGSGEGPETEQREPRPRPSTAEVRRWAKAHGIDCPAKGRIPQSVMDAYVEEGS